MSVAQEDIPTTQEKVLERKCDYLEWTKYMSRLHRMDLRLLVNTVSEKVHVKSKVGKSHLAYGKTVFCS